jgi:hypothetical protein
MAKKRKITPDRAKHINAISHTSIANISVAIHNRNGTSLNPITLKQNDSFKAMPEK